MTDDTGRLPAPADPEMTERMRERAAARFGGRPALADAVAEMRRHPSDGDLLDRLEADAVLRQTMAISRSNTPGIGRIVDMAKSVVVRFGRRNLQDALDQQTRVNLDLIDLVRRQQERMEEEVRPISSSAQRALARLEMERGGRDVRWVATRTELSSIPDGALEGGVIDPAVFGTTDPGVLAESATHLARAARPDSTLIVAPGPHDPVAVAALLRAAGCADAAPSARGNPLVVATR